MINQQENTSLPAILCLTDACDRPETELFIGLKKAGFDIDVMCNPKGKNYQRLVDAGLTVSSIALSGRFDKVGTKTIRAQLQSKDYDVIHAFNPRALACGLRASKGMDVKIAAYRGVIGNVSFLNPESWLTFLHPRVSRIVCVADAIKQYLADLRFLWLHIEPEKLQRIYKGHDLSWYQEQPADLTTIGVPAHAFVVCCTGRNRPRKGFDVLLRAAAQLPADVDVHFVLVGDVDQNQALRAQADQLQHPERVHFAGYRNDAPQVAAASNAFVLPSIEREGLPRAVIEAMAYGVPAIVSDVGGMPELVENGVSGLVVPPNDEGALAAAIQSLYNDQERAKKMGEAAKKRINDHFHTSKTVRETGDLYLQLADSH